MDISDESPAKKVDNNKQETVLLGFQNSKPVLTTRSPNHKNNKTIEVDMTNKKIFLKINPQTGKFINFNGRMLKVLPESKLTEIVRSKLELISPPKEKITSDNDKKTGTPQVIKSVQQTHSKSLSGDCNNSQLDNNVVNTKQIDNSPKAAAIGDLKVISVSPTTIKKGTVNECEANMKPSVMKKYLKTLSRTSLVPEVSKVNENLNLKQTSLVDVKQECTKCGSVSVKQSFSTSSNVKYYRLQKSICLGTEDLIYQNDKVVQTEDKKVTTVDSSCQTDCVDPFFDLIGYVTNENVLLEPNINFGFEVGKMPSVNGEDSETRTLLKAKANCEQKAKDMGIKMQFFNDLKGALDVDAQGNMPIHAAVLKNDLALVKRNCIALKARNESVNIPNQNDMTPIQLAINNSNTPLEIIDVLLKNGADLSDADVNGNNILHLAAERNMPTTLQVLLKHAQTIRFNIDQFNYEGLTPLMIAASNGGHKCADLILTYGALPNMRDQKSGRTALFHAAENHDCEMVRLLLRNKADTKIRNFFGTSPHDAMFEVDDIPKDIKMIILGKGNAKRKPMEETTDYKKKKLKTFAKFERINENILKSMPTSK